MCFYDIKKRIKTIAFGKIFKESMRLEYLTNSEAKDTKKALINGNKVS